MKETPTRIANMSDQELLQVIQLCAELFGTRLRPESVNAYVYLLKRNFNFTTDKEMVSACTEFASNPSNEHHRMSPSFLAMILRQKGKDKQPVYQEFEISLQDKEKNRILFLESLYQDFDDYCRKEQPTRIFIWRYVVKRMIRAGLINEDMLVSATEKDEYRSTNKNIYSEVVETEFKTVALNVFKDLAMQGKHISEYIK